MGPHHRALGDLVFLDVVEVLRGVAVGPVIDAFVGVGALDRLGSACHILCRNRLAYRLSKWAQAKLDNLCNSGGMKRGPQLGFDDDGRPVLITAAAPSYEDQHRQRVRKYFTLMAFRIPALVLAAVAYGAWHNGLISLAIVAASVPLPWMAVLIANDRPPLRPDEPRRFDTPRRVRRCSRRLNVLPSSPQTCHASTGFAGLAGRRFPVAVELFDSQHILSDRGTFPHVNGCETVTRRELMARFGRWTT